MTPREIRFGIDGLTAIVVASVAAALAVLTWRLAGEAGGSSPVSVAAGAYVAPAPPPDITALINLPPFGKASAASAIAPAASDLVLHGVLLTNPAPASSALIAAAGKESVAYRIGEALPNGAVLESIAVDHVFLRLSGQSLSLYFPDDPRAGKASTGAAAAAAAQPAAAGSKGVEGIRSLLPPSVLQTVRTPVPATTVPTVSTQPPPPRPEPGPPSAPTQSGLNR